MRIANTELEHQRHCRNVQCNTRRLETGPAARDPANRGHGWLRLGLRTCHVSQLGEEVCVVAITLASWQRSCNPKLERHARFGNMDANAAFTPSSLPFTGAGGGLKPVQYDAARACAMRLRPAAPGWPQKATGI